MKHVLIADDLKPLFPEQGSFLDRAEIGVLTAATNDELLRTCLARKIDLLVTQLDLPGLRTEDLFRTIRGSNEVKSLPTIICCADTLANRERCKQCSPNTVVYLPIEPVLLHLQVQQFLSIAARMSYRAPLAAAIEGHFKNTPLQFWTENISASGMLIKAMEPLEKGGGIFFSFFLAGGAHVSGYGEIIRVEQLEGEPPAYRYGIKFTNVAPDVRSAIEAVVKKQKPS